MIPTELIPLTIVHVVLALSSLGLLISTLLSLVPQAQQVLRVISLSLLISSIYLEGAHSNQDKWEKRVLEVKMQMEEVKAQSEKSNRQLAEQLEISKKNVHDVTQRNLDKIKDLAAQLDQQCKIQDEVINVMNNAAMNKTGDEK